LHLGLQEFDSADAADGKAKHHSGQNESDDNTEASPFSITSYLNAVPDLLS